MGTDPLAELARPVALPAEAAAALARDGFVRLPGLFAPTTLAHAQRAIDRAIDRRAPTQKPLAEQTAYDRAFLQVMNLWRDDVQVRRFVGCARLAQAAAQLLQVERVRLYHDQALYKEAGGGPTPWHADQYYWPLSSDRCGTFWIPLQETTAAMGPIAFSVGSHRHDLGRSLPISEESDARVAAALRATALPLDEQPVALGDATFHLGWTFHRAGENRTAQRRRAMTVIVIDAAMRVAPPRNAAQCNDLAAWFPGLAAGDLAASPLNPLLPIDPNGD